MSIRCTLGFAFYRNSSTEKTRDASHQRIFLEKNYKSIALDSHFAELSNESCKAEIGNKKEKEILCKILCLQSYIIEKYNKGKTSVNLIN